VKEFDSIALPVEQFDTITEPVEQFVAVTLPVLQFALIVNRLGELFVSVKTTPILSLYALLVTKFQPLQQWKKSKTDAPLLKISFCNVCCDG